MSSYNFLRAVSDGLAEAIRYRTDLKRRRREEEYNYNKNWERNENEYQRDLQRARNEEQWNFDLKNERLNKERDRQRKWIKDNSPYNIDTEDPIAFDEYNALANIDNVPIATKYRAPVKDTFAQEMAKLDRQHKNKMAEIDANNRGRIAAATARGAGRQAQPRQRYTWYDDYLDAMSKAKTPEQKAMIEAHYAPKSVKNGSGSNNGQYLDTPYTDKRLEPYRARIANIEKEIYNADNNFSLESEPILKAREKIINDKELSEEEKQNKLKEIDSYIANLKKEYEEKIAGLKQNREAEYYNFQKATEFLYPEYTASGSKQILIPTIIKESKANFLSDPDLDDIDTRIPPANQFLTLYSENPNAPVGSMTAEVIPTNASPLPVIPQSVATPTVNLMASPTVPLSVYPDERTRQEMERLRREDEEYTRNLIKRFGGR